MKLVVVRAVRVDDNCRVATVVPAEGAVLERVRETAHALSAEGLSREAYGRFDAAQTKTAWGRRHRRRVALVDGPAVGDSWTIEE